MYDNTKEIAQQIFNRSPSDLNSIDLEMDKSTIDFIENEKVFLHNHIRDIISMITLHGIEILYGHRNIMSLTEEQLFLVKRYTRSYGFQLNIKIEQDTIMISFDKI